MTNICRLILLILLLQSKNAFALDGKSHLWSNDWREIFSPSSVNLESVSPFFFGISWGGSFPKEENADRLFSLASVKKIITAATSLRELGGDFQFSSEFTGEVDSVQGVLFSPAFSVSGDPTWAHPAFGENLYTRTAKVVSELKKQKIKKVVGDIQIHLLRPAVGQFHRPLEWKKEWLLQCYAALPTPVSLYGNCAELSIKSAQLVQWNTAGVSTPIENKMFAAKKDSLLITPVLDAYGRVEKYVVSGGFVSPVEVSIPVQNNEGWLKNIFIQQLNAAGIIYSRNTLKFVPSKNLHAFYVDISSKKLKQILVPFLEESINLVGDRLHIEAPGDFITLASLLPDPVEYQNVTLLDGSGLIAADKITPRTMLHLLKALQTQSYFQDLYLGLPISGMSGTLQNRMNDALLKSRVHAKTGSLDHVANLAGYWTKSDQSLEPFVIFTESDLSGADARSKIDAQVSEFARKN